MRRLTTTPNQGIVGIQSPRPITFVNARAYNRPDDGLSRLDRLRAGGTPEIILTRRNGGIGDVLMTIPTARALAEKYQCQIDYGTDFEYLDGALPAVLQGLPYIRRVIPHGDIDSSKYDAVLDLTCPCIAHEQPHAPPISRMDLFARHLGITLSNTQIDYQHTQEELTVAFQELQKLRINQDRHRLILIQPSASTTRRDMPSDILKQMVRKLASEDNSLRFLVVTHESDGHLARQYRWQDINFTHKLHNYSIRQIAAVMSYCDLVICPDSSILHLAGALHKPSLSFFGPTDPRARINYYPEAVAIAPGVQLKCWTCWFSSCNAHYTCWKRLELDMCVKTAQSILAGKPLEPHPEIFHFGSMSVQKTAYEIL